MAQEADLPHTGTIRLRQEPGHFAMVGIVAGIDLQHLRTAGRVPDLRLHPVLPQLRRDSRPGRSCKHKKAPPNGRRWELGKRGFDALQARRRLLRGYCFLTKPIFSICAFLATARTLASTP